MGKLLACLGSQGVQGFDEETLVFKVGSKMFALTNINSPKLSISLKCYPFMSQDLRHDYPCIKPGYHLNKEHWNTIEIDGTLEDNKIFYLIDHSYNLVFKGLKKSEKAAIEES